MISDACVKLRNTFRLQSALNVNPTTQVEQHQTIELWSFDVQTCNKFYLCVYIYIYIYIYIHIYIVDRLTNNHTLAISF